MTEYKQYSVNLSPSQSQKLVKAIEMKAPVTLRLKSVDLTGSDTIFLTSTQINKIKKAKSLNKGVDIDFSKTQISNIRSKIGSGIRNRRNLPTTQPHRVPHRAPRPLPTQDRTGMGLRNRPRPFDYNDFAQYQPPPPFIGDWSDRGQMIKKKRIGMQQ